LSAHLLKANVCVEDDFFNVIIKTRKSLGMPENIFEALRKFAKLKTTSTKSFNFSNTLTCTTSSRKTIVFNHICGISI